MDPEIDNGNEPGQEPNAQPGMNPKWKPLLDVLPDDLHGIVQPYLKEWDSGVTQQFQAIREEYNPYKEFVEGKVDPGALKQALMLAQAVEQDPAGVVQRMVDHFNLEQYKATQAPSNIPDPDLDELNDLGVDPEILLKHPAFKALKDQLDQVSQFTQQQRQVQEESQANSAIQDYLSDLHEQFDDDQTGFKFDDQYVISLLAAGVDGEVAVQNYKALIDNARTGFVPATQQQAPQAPMVMGGAGSTGSGIPANDVKMGDLKESQVNDLVAQILAQAAQENPNN